MAAVARIRTLVRPARSRSVRASDVVALLVGNGLLIGAMWVRHGGLGELATTAGTVTAAGQLTALYGTYLSLIGLLLMSRSPWLEGILGMDRLAGIHRLVGFSTVWLIGAHAVLTTVGYAMGDGSSVVAEAWTLLTTYPYVLMATVSMGLFIAIAAASVRAARRRLSYETWYGIHLYTYLAVALGFAHQLAVGTDFTADPMAQLYWAAMYVVVIASILVFRLAEPIALAVRHRLRVANVIAEAPGVVSIYVTGRDLDQLPVRSGQYFLWRFLTRDRWWRAHPFSVSAAPNGEYLRFTVKASGDDSAVLQRIPIGTRVLAEGPYGALTDEVRTMRRVLLIAGGIGITPLRALLEELPAGPGELELLYRASTWSDLVFRDELDALARLRGATVRYLVGRRGIELAADPLDPRSIRALVPDVAGRDVYVCGPVSMIDAVRRALDALRVPAALVHWERFDYY